MIAMTVTHARLTEIIEYTPESGVFTWRTSRGGKAQAGRRAGSINDGYWHVRVDDKLYRANRLAHFYMTSEWPVGQMDHIDGDRANDAWSNLRDVSGAANQQNRRTASMRSSSGLLGAFRSGKRWSSKIVANGNMRRLGTYDTPEEAHQAYLKAKRELHAGCTI